MKDERDGVDHDFHIDGPLRGRRGPHFTGRQVRERADVRPIREAHRRVPTTMCHRDRAHGKASRGVERLQRSRSIAVRRPRVERQRGTPIQPGGGGTANGSRGAN